MLPLFTVMVGSGLTITCNVTCGDVPQLLLAVTVKIPVEPGVAEIVLLTLVPAQPAGKLQL
jgi:hypothetical protein